MGVLSADVLAGTSRGLARAAAYDAGLAHTMGIAIGIAAASLLVSLAYAYRLRRRRG